MPDAREQKRELVDAARFLFERGLAFATSGNVSLREGDRILITPTGASLGSLRSADIAKADLDGSVIGKRLPSKELPFHLAIYRARPDVAAVVHVHSHYAVALACLRDLNTEDALPPLTPYYVMSAGRLPVAPYFPPGDARLGAAVEARAAGASAVLLRNHGLIAYGATLQRAVYLTEEVEATARLFLELGDRAQALDAASVAELRARFPRT